MERKSIGSFIAALRRANGMTQQELADRLNVSNKAVSRWERDETMPDLTLIPCIAEIFGVTCDEILRGEPASVYTPVRRPEPDQGGTAPQAQERGERRGAALLERTATRLRTSAIISLALIALGVVLMFLVGSFFQGGITVIGVLVMLIFDIAAAVMATLSALRVREIRRAAAAESCNTDAERLVNSASRWSFSVFASLFIVLWLTVTAGFLPKEIYFMNVSERAGGSEVTVYDPSVVNMPEGAGGSVMTVYDPSAMNLLLLSLCPVPFLYICYEPYMRLLTGAGRTYEAGRAARRMRAVDAALILLTAVMLVCSEILYMFPAAYVISRVLVWSVLAPLAASLAVPIIYAARTRTAPSVLECVSMIGIVAGAFVTALSVSGATVNSAPAVRFSGTTFLIGAFLILVFIAARRLLLSKIKIKDSADA